MCITIESTSLAVPWALDHCLQDRQSQDMASLVAKLKNTILIFIKFYKSQFAEVIWVFLNFSLNKLFDFGLFIH